MKRKNNESENSVKVEEICPCCSGEKCIDCCAKPHQNLANAKTCEALMRSRYTAFVRGDGDYLMKSIHSLTRKVELKAELVRWAKSVKWLKLEIVNTTFGQENDEEGTVEFKAYFKEGTKREVMHQNGKFVREYGNWVYFDLV